MAAYSLRHYGQATIVLRPHVIVIHFTAGPSYESAHSVFVQDAPNTGELPGVVSHFVIDKDGTIYQQLPTDLRGRHAIGLKYKVWRLWHLVADFFRSRTPGWWLKVYVLYFIWQLLRATVYSDFMFEEQRRIHEAAPPTQEQIRVLLGGR